ncbi:MAG: hypothetical protein U1F49_20950 [Rubrivivax sp.]
MRWREWNMSAGFSVSTFVVAAGSAASRRCTAIGAHQSSAAPSASTAERQTGQAR